MKMRERRDWLMAKAVDKRLYGALKPIRRRILLRHFIKYVVLGAILALAQVVVWLCASFFVPIPYMWQKAAACGFGILLISVVVSAFYRPSLKDVAREADRLGLQERAITAYERMGLDDAFSVMQREDTIRRLKELDTAAISVTPPKKWMLGLVGMALLILVGGMLPNPQNQIVDRRIRVQREIENQVEQLQDKVQENLTTQAELTAEEKQELMHLVNQLARRLRQTSDYKEAIKEVSKAEQQLAGLVKRFRQYRMGLLGEALERHLLTRELGQAAKAMEAQGIEHALESLKEQIKQENMDAEAMQSLEAALKSAADALPNGSLKKQLEKAAGAVASAIAGQSGDVTRELDSLQEMLTYMAQEGFANPADIQYLLQNMKNSIASAAGQDIRLAQNVYGADQGLSSHSNGKTNRGPDSQKGNGQNSGGQSSNGQGSGGQNTGDNGSGSDGQGSGSGQGDQGSDGPGNVLGDRGSGSGSTSTGQGSSSVGAGTGTGAGHMNRDAGYQEVGTSSQQGTKGQGDPDSYGDYKRIYDSTRLGDGGQASQVTGKPSGQGASEQTEAGPGLGSFDGFVPYNEVFGSYSRQAMQNLERMNIPAGMRELIKEYFNAIE
jgi:hypothetical protein